MLKPRELIELHGAGPLTLQDRRVFNELVRNAWGQQLGVSGHWFEIDTGQLRSATDRNARLSTSLERLMRTICTVINEDGTSTLRTPLLSSNEIKTTANGGTLRYKLTEELAGLLHDSRVFAKLDLEVMKAFSSKYAFSLYEAISRRIRMQRFKEYFSLQDLRELLGVEDGKLTTYRNLNVRAIQPALTEVNAITDYQVGIQPKKEGRKVVGFWVGWNEKDEKGKQEATNERERASVGRKTRVSEQSEQVIEENKPEGIAPLNRG